MYAIKFQATECASTSGYVVTKEGEWQWIVVEPEGWVPATTCADPIGGGIPGDVKTFPNLDAAQAFAKRWPKIFHPWYSKPNGTYEFVEIKPRYKQVITGYQEA